METTQNQESQTKTLTDVITERIKPVEPQSYPEELKIGQENNLVGNLETAIKGAVEQIKHCDVQISLWTKQKQDLQTKMHETLDRIQKQFLIAPVPDEKKRTRMDKNASLPELIRSYLEKNGPSRTRDIRKYLLGLGRKTNPGVALGRMTKDGTIKNVDRGVYQII